MTLELWKYQKRYVFRCHFTHSPKILCFTLSSERLKLSRNTRKKLNDTIINTFCELHRPFFGLIRMALMAFIWPLLQLTSHWEMLTEVKTTAFFSLLFSSHTLAKQSVFLYRSVLKLFFNFLIWKNYHQFYGTLLESYLLTSLLTKGLFS